MAYIIYKSDGSLFLTLADGQIDTNNTSLTLLGKNVTNYGQYENTNLVKLLENFASPTAPANPTAGQLWFDKNNDVLRLKVYNGSAWRSLPNFTLSTSTPIMSEGDFWWNTESQILYIKNTSTLVQIGGPAITVTSATRLANSISINNVPFTGTASITVSATLTNSLSFGSYIVGSTFNGSSATTINVDVGTVTVPTPNKVVARDSGGNVYFNVGYGTATASRYADLAEKYIADKPYDVGTVVIIGGDCEVTESSLGKRAIGVVSENPGFMMNKDLETGTYIALKGRVPVKVSGIIKKGQRLIAGDKGTAVGINHSTNDVFAISLEDNNGKDTVEALIL